MVRRGAHFRCAGVAGLVLLAVLMNGCGEGQADVVVGTAVPGLKVLDATGNPITLELPEDQVVMVQFFANSCCSAQLPITQTLQTTFAGRGVHIIAVNVGDEQEAIDDMVEDFGLTFTVVRDALQVSCRRYGVTGLPTTYIVGVDGVLQRKILGTGRYGDFAKALEGALAIP